MPSNNPISALQGTIWKIDPAKLASATQAEGGAKEVAKGYKTVVSHFPRASAKAHMTVPPLWCGTLV